MLSSLCVYCASSPGADPDFASAASHFGRLLARQGIRLVYGGGRVGVMGVLADGFVMLPGGFGTLDEFMEAVAWTQLGVHTKRCGVLNVKRFFHPLLALLDAATEERFLRPDHRDIVLVGSKP